MPFSCPLFPAIARPMPRHEGGSSTTSTTPNSTSTSHLPPTSHTPFDIPFFLVVLFNFPEFSLAEQGGVCSLETAASSQRVFPSTPLTPSS
ncbi:hypothetical protein I7I50_06362 [Histoplasma capsulatum G186AR]|nr:hypothetical protein I7I52_10565 [Histoplasma capsulatum]QSS67326.1 hypothetical protein I7I50_06362 [Histoplasma capsulatum G186AR]